MIAKLENKRRRKKKMKKVWVLEKFAGIEEQERFLKSAKELREGMIEEVTSEGTLETLNLVIAKQESKMAENPNGWWQGFEGKTNYGQFIQCARRAIRDNPGEAFRVVTAEIEDDAKYWLGYTNPVVNEGVMRYLMATR